MIEDKKPQEQLADTVILLRTLRGLTQAELAARSGLSDVYVRQIERGERDISIGSLEKLASGLGCDPGELLGSPRGKATNHIIGEAFGAASDEQKRAVIFVLRAEDPGESSERAKLLLKLLADEIEPLTAPVPTPRARRSASAAGTAATATTAATAATARAKKPRVRRARKR